MAAHRVIRDLLALCSDVICLQQGTVIKTVGDEIMAAFSSSEHAVLAAAELLRHLESGAADQAPGLRIGMHFGEVLLEDGDLFGSTVNIAARMVEMARCGQIITTAASLPAPALETQGLEQRSLGMHRLPGMNAPLEVVEIICRTTGATTNVSTQPSLVEASRNTELSLQCGETEIVLKAGCEPLSLGRDASAGLVVDAHYVSRLHAVIEYRRGFFLLRDVSTNGTFVVLDGSGLIALHHNEFTLRGTGCINLGRRPAAGKSPALRFKCV
jgi:hypothetical protein